MKDDYLSQTAGITHLQELSCEVQPMLVYALGTPLLWGVWGALTEYPENFAEFSSLEGVRTSKSCGKLCFLRSRRRADARHAIGNPKPLRNRGGVE